MFTVTTIEGLRAARSSKTSYKTISHFHQAIESLDNGLKGKRILQDLCDTDRMLHVCVAQVMK